MGGYKFRRIAALLVISLVLSLIGAGAGSAEPRPPSALEPPTVLEKGDKNLALLPSQGLGENDDPRDPSTFARATRRMIEATWNIDLPDPAGIESESVPSSSFVVKGTIRSAMPAGDINGDGLPDVLSIEYSSVDYSRKIVALNGFDGSELWTYSRDSYDGFPLPVGDLTGDGAGDVLFVSYTIEWGNGPCYGTLVAFACAGGYDYTWSYELRSGPTGDLVWSRDWDGENTFTWAVGYPFPAFAFVGLSTYTNALVLPIVSGDHSGDGLPDLIINRYDRASAFTGQGAFVLVGGAFTGQGAPIYTTTADLLNGVKGETFHSVGPVGSWAMLLPAGNAVGDESVDLLWQRSTPLPYVYSYASLVLASAYAVATETITQADMIDGDTLQTIWSTQRGNAVYYPLLEDLTGDGRADIFLVDLGTQACLWTYETSTCSPSAKHGVIGGSDGALRWQGDGWIYPNVIGSVGGEPGQDLLIISSDYSYNQQTISSKRVDGATGNTLFETHVSGETETGYESTYVAVLGGDADGDGVDDIRINRSTYSSVESHSVAIESGRDGETIFTKALDTPSYYWVGWDPDADGLTDLAAFSIQIVSGDTQIDISSVDVPSGLVTWERTDSHPGYFYAGIFRIGDQSGAGGDDFIYSRTTWDPPLSRFDSLDGATGAVRWGYGDVLPTSTSTAEDEPAPPLDDPENDQRDNALVMTDLPYTDSQNTITATMESDERSPCQLHKSVWYSYTPLQDETVVADTFGSDFDTALAVYDASNLHAAKVCNNDMGATTQSEIFFEAKAGTTYLFQVGGFYWESGDLVFNARVFNSQPSEDWVWPALDDASIRPGVRIYLSDIGWCTANFVFRGTGPRSDTLYLGTAGHCANSFIGTTVRLSPKYDYFTDEAGPVIGRVAYSSFKELGPTDNDFALIQIDEAHKPHVHPALLHYGGPTGLKPASELKIGDRVLTYGSTPLRADVAETNRREGYVVGIDEWTSQSYLFTPGVFGDSGSPVLHSDGSALGILVTIGFVPPAWNGATHLEMAKDFASSVGWNVELQTWCILDVGLFPNLNSSSTGAC